MLDVKIGQMILIGFAKAEVDPQVLEEIKRGRVGSVIIFEKNIPKTNSFAALKKIIWTYQKASSIPLIIAIDQEGGKVNRLKDKYGFSRSITAEAMGKNVTMDSVKFYAEATASTLAGLGINVNLAPVVDVAINKDNPVIVKNGRAFSANADTVAWMAAEFIKAHKRFGITTVLKHFPGHGSSMADSHLGVTDVTNTWKAEELIPYQRLIASANADAIMTAHIVNKKLDPKALPGTLSSRIIDSLLRKEMHFEGLVFSDDMQMQAITKEYGLEEAIRLSINAGVDILCFSNNLIGSEERTADKVHGIIRMLVDNGKIKPERIDESFNRIMKVKSGFGTSNQQQLIDLLNAALREIEELKKGKSGVDNQTNKGTAEDQTAVKEEDTGKKKKKKKKT